MIETCRSEAGPNMTEYTISVPFNDFSSILYEGYYANAVLKSFLQFNEKCKSNGVKLNLDVLVIKVSILKMTAGNLPMLFPSAAIPKP